MEPRSPLLAVYVIFIQLNMEELHLKTGNHQSEYNTLKKALHPNLPQNAEIRQIIKSQQKTYIRLMF